MYRVCFGFQWCPQQESKLTVSVHLVALFNQKSWQGLRFLYPDTEKPVQNRLSVSVSPAGIEPTSRA